MSLKQGTYVGPYRLLSVLNARPTVEIWEALHDASGQRFAIKAIKKAHADREQLRYLQHEFKVGQSLKHKNIVAVEALVPVDGTSCLVMELFPHPNLKQRIQQSHAALRPLTSSIIRQAVDSLDHMHQQGWVHCDVKPDNFLISDTGELKLIDFALAQPARSSWLRRLVPRGGQIQGTPSYISPEQIRKETLAPATDIYSLGCALYELVTGKVPFTGVSTNELLTKHLRVSPPSAEVSPGEATREFADLLKLMMAKDPQQRPPLKEVADRITRMSILKSD